jgi:hypothetical protein
MERKNARFAEFTLPDVKQRRLGVQLDVADLEPYCLADTNTSTRHQSEEGLISMGSQSASVPNGQRCIEKSGNFVCRI